MRLFGFACAIVCVAFVSSTLYFDRNFVLKFAAELFLDTHIRVSSKCNHYCTTSCVLYCYLPLFFMSNVGLNDFPNREENIQNSLLADSIIVASLELCPKR